MITRTRKFVTKIEEFLSLCEYDQTQLPGHNLPLLVLLSSCSMFSSNLLWTKQLSPLLGCKEVDKLNSKLRSLNVSGLDSLHISYRQFFSTTTFKMEEDERRLMELVEEIGSWYQVNLNQ